MLILKNSKNDMAKQNTRQDNELLIYQAKNGAIELKLDASNETIYATRMQMSEMFGVETPAITKHIQNIYNEKELEKSTTSSKMELVQTEGSRKVTRQVDYYNLEVLIAVGYRISSVMGTKFRQWATKTLKHHITDGFTINKSRIVQNHKLFMQSVEEVKKLNKNKELSSEDVLDIVKLFGHTWFSLDAYDKGELIPKIEDSESLRLEAKELYKDLAEFKTELMRKGQATDIFGTEKNTGAVEGILGNVFQTAFGEDVYPCTEAKAANLMYFVIKNHPFNDGNKRSGAFCLIWFLQKSGVDFLHTITPQTLTSLTLLVATSDPEDKDRMVNLIMSLISGDTA